MAAHEHPVIDQHDPAMPRARVNVIAQGSRLGPIYLLSCAAFIGYLMVTAEDSSMESWAGFIMVAAPTLASGWLWCTQPTLYGFPLWPAIALTSLPAYAIPLISNQSNVMVYDPQLRLTAAGLLALYFIAGLVAWMVLSRRPLPKRRTVAVLRYVDHPAASVVLTLPALLFELNRQFGYINLGELFSILRTATMGFFLIGVYLYGSSRRRRHTAVAWLFWIIFWAYGLTTLLSLYILPIGTAMVVMLTALIVGQQRVPWRLLTLCAALIGFLQEGKGDMRSEVNRYALNPTTVVEVGEFLGRWLDFSWQRISTGRAEYQRAEQYSSALDRINLLHLTLRTVDEAPQQVPYLWGQTYAQIPSVLAPRFLVPDKPWSLIGTHILNIHYGIQTADQVYDTTIGWGLINEAHANFGGVGVVLLGVLLGAATGAMGRRTRGLPPTSMSTLFAFALIPIVTNTEMTATVVAATLFQQLVIFAGLFLALTKRVEINAQARTSA